MERRAWGVTATAKTCFCRQKHGTTRARFRARPRCRRGCGVLVGRRLFYVLHVFSRRGRRCPHVHHADGDGDIKGALIPRRIRRSLVVPFHQAQDLFPPWRICEAREHRVFANGVAKPDEAPVSSRPLYCDDGAESLAKPRDGGDSPQHFVKLDGLRIIRAALVLAIAALDIKPVRSVSPEPTKIKRVAALDLHNDRFAHRVGILWRCDGVDQRPEDLFALFRSGAAVDEHVDERVGRRLAGVGAEGGEVVFDFAMAQPGRQDRHDEDSGDNGGQEDDQAQEPLLSA